MTFFMLNDRAVQPFVLFSKSHIITLSVIVIVNFLVYINRNKFKGETPDKVVRYLVATTLILLEGSLGLYQLSRGSWTLANSLPLQLCSILVFLSALMLVTKNYRLYEFVYLLGIAGATQALLTPDLGYGFPHFGFYQFFINHGLIIFSALYMTLVHGYRPYHKSIFRTFMTLNLTLPFILLTNFLTGGNYFFLAQKPQSASLLDYLGPWPWYILSLEFVALFLLFLAYSPFALKDFRKKKKARPSRFQ